MINLDDIFRTVGGDIKQHDERRMGRMSGFLCLSEGLKLPITQKWAGTFVTQSLISSNFALIKLLIHNARHRDAILTNIKDCEQFKEILGLFF